MLQNISVQEMFMFLREIYPTVDKTALARLAKDKIGTMESELEPMIRHYLSTGMPTEFEHGEFSLSYIMALRKCRYPRAVLLMDEYMKDPVKGKFAVLRR